ncbi:MAG: Dabb family protein [Shimia sp.]|uniref:Dabb family protein n=1 Tax=Shimia sp. TaxID=1954381 RepID=UPI003B8AFC9E
MIRHCVMLNLQDDTQEKLSPVLDGLAELVDTLQGCSGFVAGINRDFERKSPNHPFGFMFDVENEAALNTYAEHPRHKQLGATLVSLCNGGAEGIMVFDIEVMP